MLYNQLVIEQMSYLATARSSRLDATFAALADPTRRAILARLARGEASVNDLAKPFNMSQPAVSKHLKVLERAGLISKTLDKQRRPRRLEPAPLKDASAWLEKYAKFWEARFDRLDVVLDEMEIEAKSKRSKRNVRKS